MSLISRAISGNNQFSDPFRVGDRRAVHFSAVGTFVGTLVLQCRFNYSSDSDWRTVFSVTDAEVENATIIIESHCDLRVGSTAYTSGNPVVEARIAREREGNIVRHRFAVAAATIVVPTITYDLSSGLPSGLSGRNGQTFANVGSFTETSPIPYNDPFNQDKAGYWSDNDDFDARGAFDLRLTFAWTVDATGFPDVRPGPAIFDTDASTDGLSPWTTSVIVDRNNPLVFPGRLSNADVQGIGSLTNVGANYVPSGSELTADGSTLHTVGFQIDGLTYRAFFDGTEIDNFQLTTAERALVDGCTKIGTWYFNDGETELHYRHSKLELAPAGTIY